MNADKPHRELPHGDFEVRPDDALELRARGGRRHARTQAVRFEERPVGEQPFSPEGAGMVAQGHGPQDPDLEDRARLGGRDLARRRGVVRPVTQRDGRAGRGP